MCGFVLKEASGASKSPAATDENRSPTNLSTEADSNEGERPSRVRQRTISVSGNTNFVSNVVEARPEPVVPPQPVASPVLPPQAPVRPQIPQPVPEKDFEIEVEADAEEFFEEDFNDNGEDENFENDAPNGVSEEVAATSELVKKKRRRRRRKKKPAVSLGGEVAVPVPTTPVVPVQQEATIAPIVEETPVRQPAPVIKPEPQQMPRAAAPVEVLESVQAEEGLIPWRNTPNGAEVKPGFRIESPSQSRSEKQPQLDTRGSVENQRRQEPRQLSSNGSLVGWLVSFVEDGKGKAYELRDGRFFVGKESLRATDFVIDHSSVSTPQCLVVCDSIGGVTIQDLMSERGTTVIRGSAGLDKNSEQVRLENGDRIRFGDYEMLFVKLPQSR
jgi:hypothetical protein